MAFAIKLRWIGGITLALAAAFGGATALATAPPADPGQTAPRRIVSLNLCTDQLVLALADREQIAGLTRYAGDPQMSAAARESRGLRILRGSAEELVAIKPDLVIGTPARRSSAVAVLGFKTYPVLDLKSPTSYEEIRRSIREVAVAVGHRDRGEALIARMDRELAQLPKLRRPVVAAYYQRRGYLTGTGTLVDDLMTRAGIVNLAGKLKRPRLSQISLEELAVSRPDYLIVDTATERVVDEGTAMMHHPVIAGIPRIGIPQAWTVCGGPAYVKAAQALVEGVNAR
ncbi:ABC transporter substrate-binding protein [Novosphingobium sp. M1R2S20]|uniref:ABC transporter substrate-binding protein n=1 Tax=Novosphingobium rhizovicinum TaxID=3228928 RepID=A0ABV3REK5_9SPHN